MSLRKQFTNAGQLDRKITVVSFATVRDAAGQDVHGAETTFDIWAARLQGAGRDGRGEEEERSNQIQSFKSVTFMVRYRTDINEAMQIRYDGETYKIHTIQKSNERKEHLLIHTEVIDL